MSENPPGTPPADPAGEDRRKGGDRRQAQKPFAGPERRKGERRSGKDRRATPRSEPEA